MLLGRSLTVGGSSRPVSLTAVVTYKWVISEQTFTPRQVILSMGAEIPDSGFYHKLRPSCLFPAPFSDCQEIVENRDTCDTRFLLPWSIRATETDWEHRASPTWPKRLGTWATRSKAGLADRPSPQNWWGPSPAAINLDAMACVVAASPLDTAGPASPGNGVFIFSNMCP